MKRQPTFEEVSARLSYEPDTGVLRWKINNGRARAGAVAGTFTHGYTRINVSGSLQYAHRIAWLLSYGSWPEHEIDHVNMNRNDNRITNLRSATKAQNTMNRKAKGKLGLKGVRVQRNGLYSAIIWVSGKWKYLGGNCKTPEEANSLFVSAAQKLHGEFWRAG